MEPITSDHSCYILRSLPTKRCYIGYTTNLQRRLRQHNGEITGGAKKTRFLRPWTPICLIKGFYDNTSALRFEWKMQHPYRRIRRGECPTSFYLEVLNYVINNGDGNPSKNNVLPWPTLYISWFEHSHAIYHPNVYNFYVTSLPIN